MIFITHNLGVARAISDRIYVMYAGTIVEESKGTKLFEKQLHPYTEGSLSSFIPKLNKKMVKGIEGTLPSFIDPPKGCRFYDRCAQRMEICNTKAPQLIQHNENQKVACFLYDKQTVLSKEPS